MSLLTLPARKKNKPTKAKAPEVDLNQVVAAEPLATRRIHRHLQSTPDGVWAWYGMESIPWAFTKSGWRASVFDATTIRWADLAGHRIHLRRTGHPIPYSVWAQRLDNATPYPLGTNAWADYLERSQLRIASKRAAEPATYLGVRVTTAQIKPEHLHLLLTYTDNSDAKVAKARTALAKVTNAVAKDGFKARPLNARQLGWLIHASVGLHMPVSVNSLAGPSHDWTEEDIETFTKPVYVSAGPMSHTIGIRALRDGRTHERRIAVLSVGRMGDRDTESPAYDPWLSYIDKLPFAVEVSWSADVLAPVDALPKATYTRQRAQDIADHHDDHNETPQPAVARGIRDAFRVEDEISEGEREIAVRMVGPIRFAVAGANDDEVAQNVATLRDAYSMGQKIALEEHLGQYPAYREFIPGEPASRVGFQRAMPGYYAATAVPTATFQLGDGEGPYLGTGPGNSPVFFDTTWGPRHNKPGMVVVLGEPGAGKSSLCGALIYPEVLRRHQTIVYDPSGPLAKLTKIPEIAAYSRATDLSGAEPGTFNPYWLIPDPIKDWYRTENEWRSALAAARADRMELAGDVMLKFLRERIPGDATAISHAVAAVGGEFAANPWRVIHLLEEGDNAAVAVAAQLRSQIDLRGIRQMFPENERGNYSDAEDVTEGSDHKVLTVLTMQGIEPPPLEVPREDWTTAERMSVPVLHLAARYGMRAMYANQDPKNIWTDEGGIIAGGGSTFRSALIRGSRDARKTGSLFGVISQNAIDLLAIAAQISNLIGASFVGRIQDEETSRAALPILGIPEDHGYEKALMRLETGQFLHRDWMRRTNQVNVDIKEWLPNLFEAIHTTPPQLTKGDVRKPSWTDELVFGGAA